MAFLVFEGLDGSGKSTLIQNLAHHLQTLAVPFLITREPGGTPLGEEVRDLLLRPSGEAPSPRTELLLYEAVRAQHVDLKIRPALESGRWVLCDRFTASTIAFQCGGRSLPSEPVEWLNDFATDKIKPDLWVLIDLPVTESMKRLEKREGDGKGGKDRFEQEASQFHQNVRDSYLAQARQNPQQWLILDGMKSPDALLQELLSELRKRQWLPS